ncbi:protein naked cuticle homolog [Anopheles maculipalpis]|uniref:protein naked cuticle homolog n=1 Tax=Anopheles maculipalpis TaxID=1496333 RepID=UPI00215973FA|nr:protein naked cuticle homolog [Anopheles maculipalpis]
MAGNIVKWWKHKILGGYKQFTVLQECATDSEELIYPGRAPSACSAPPDLLLTSDREQMLKVKSSSSTGAAPGQTKSSVHHHHHHHGHQQQSPSANGHNHSSASQPQQHHHKSQKEAFRKSGSGKMGSGGGAAGALGGGATNTINTTAATIRSDPDRVRLEEFTCDVSLEDGKKPQPLQFSFTLYDLDGHGKITKDDIAGIVSTIYESIGKSVVVPHYGSKTINVRLTVSPDGKTAAAKPASAAVKKAIITPRRRYRSRKLISDDDGSDTSENCPRLLRNRTAAAAASVSHGETTNNNQTALPNQQHQQQQHHHHHHHHPNGSTGKLKESNLSKANALADDCQVNCTIGQSNSSESSAAAGQLLVDAYHNNLSSVTTGAGVEAGKSSILNNTFNATKNKAVDNIYESINNLKCCNLRQQQQNHYQTASHNTSIAQTTVASLPVGSALNQSNASTAALICRDCIDGPTTTLLPTLASLDTVVIPTPPSAAVVGRAKRKLVRKTRSSRKTAVAAKMMAEDFQRRPRARSLSVGNENCYENVIGRMAAAQEECWKSSLCRRELIEIIRESMVKNSLCFQPNRKAIESSPKHRHRSHTIASRVGDQVFFNYHHPTAAALVAANNGVTAAAAELGGAQAATTSTTTTALFAIAGHEANLCGYDSYLHKTICAAANGGGAANMQLAAAHTTATINGGVQALASSTPNRLLQQHFHHAKLKRKEHHRLAAAVGAVRSAHPTPVKLSTALLNQQYPNLSAEQKLTRSINQVEQWLDHRSPKILPKVKLTDEVQPQRTTAVGRPLKRSKSKEELTPSNLLLLENLKISEDIAEIAVVTPKKVFNKESLIASATKKNIKTQHQHQHQHSSPRPPTSPTVEASVEKSVSVTKQSIPNGDAQLIQLQYGSVPVNAEPSECENLIRMSDDGEDESQPQLATAKQQFRHHPQSRSQPQSPQHHQHHHQQQRPKEPRYCGSGGAHSVSSASAASTTAVHRYVHEHIHHHYHHFENDPDES